MFGLMVYFVATMGAMQGAAVGYNATNHGAATVQYNGTHVSMGAQQPENVTLNFSEDEAQRPLENQTESVLPIGDSREREIHPAVKSFARETAHALLLIGFGTADLVAGFVYHNQWIPKPVLNGLFKAMSYGMVLGVFVFQVARVRRFYD